MLHKFPDWFQKYERMLALAAAGLGLLFYVLRSLHFAQHIPSTVWDEGMYMYKGWLFTSARFTPFEDGGVWTNQMPAAYFMAGLPQVMFGPGLAVGRYAAMLMGTLSMLGLGLAGNRLGGRWWGAAVLWVAALNTGWVMAFSQMFSQGMVSFLLAWMLYFMSSPKADQRELAAAALLAGLAGMVRINMLPLVPLVVMYIWWRTDRRTAVWGLAAGLLPVVVFHALYWPEILKIWAYWIPEGLFPGIAAYRSPWREIFLPADFSWWPISDWWGDPTHLAQVGVDALIDALRANFISWFGVLAALALIPWRRAWADHERRKLFLFLVISYSVMLVVHVWAALGGQTCQFVCLPGYFLFFNWLGILALPASAADWNLSRTRWAALAVVLIGFFTLVSFEYRYQDNYREARSDLVFDLFGIPEAVLKDEPLSSEDHLPAFWAFLQDSLGVDVVRWLRFLWLNDFLTRVLWWLIPLLLAFGFPWMLWWLVHRYQDSQVGYLSFSLASLLVLIVIGAPKPIFSQPLRSQVCPASVLERHKEIGERLDALIPAGSQVFWDVKSDIPLLYLSEAHTWLPQQNFRYTLVRQPDADPETLARFGWWNLATGEDWIAQADYAVVENRFADYWGWDARIRDGQYRVIERLPSHEMCTDRDAGLMVLKAVPQP